MTTDLTPALAPTERTVSRWGAFGHAAFTVIWAASIVSNVGTAMFDTASGWLMTSLNADPIAVSLVQVAVSLPLFLFTLPAGALADVIDSRRLLIVVEVVIIIIAAIFAAMVSLGLATPEALLLTNFLLGASGALSAPAWNAITPLLVPRPDLEGAIAANSVGYNISRAVGPALGGVVIAALGIAAPLWVFGASNVGMIAALLWWRSPRKSADSLPAERLTSAVRTGLRHAANNRYLRATLMRALAFFPFASAYWALLPLVARSQMVEGPELYGILLGALGAGAIGGSLMLNWLKANLGPDRVVALGTFATALALVLFGLAHRPAIADLRLRRRRRFLDHRIGESLCVGPGRVARLGARPRARDIPHRHLRGDDDRQRCVGTTCRQAWAVDRAFRGGGRRRAGDSPDLALEAPDRHRH